MHSQSQTRIQTDEGFYRYMTVDELIVSYQNGIPEYQILAALYSSQDEEQYKKAKAFEDRIKFEEEENEPVEENQYKKKFSIMIQQKTK